MPSTPIRKLYTVCACYGVLLAILLPQLSLWLDEVLYLLPMRDGTTRDVIQYSATNGGGVPLGYLFSFTAVKLLGLTAFAARLPSAIFSIAAGIGIFHLARRFGARFPLLAVGIFFALPLQLRYALEARPYSEALCLTIWSTVAFLRLVDKPTINRALVYWILLEIGLYIQPYSLFVAFAHAAWLLIDGKQTIANLKYVAPAIAICLASFIPWYLYSEPLWRADVATYESAAHFDWKSIQLIVKELVGLGYPGTLLIGSLAIFGCLRLAPAERRFLAIYLAIPIAGAIAANLMAGYFLAIRQVIFVLAPLSLLAALGLEQLAIARKSTAQVLGILLLLGCCYGNAAFFLRPRENWSAAAARLTQLQQTNACVIASPADSIKLYSLFSPTLASGTCTDPQQSIAVAISPYRSDDSYAGLKRELETSGRKVDSEADFGGIRIVLYGRPSAEPSH